MVVCHVFMWKIRRRDKPLKFLRVPEAEDAVIGRSIDGAAANAPVDGASAATTTIGEIHSYAGYRRRFVGVLAPCGPASGSRRRMSTAAPSSPLGKS